jgi:hypothetical protein
MMACSTVRASGCRLKLSDAGGDDSEQDAETPFCMSVLGVTLDVRTRTAQPTPESRQTMQEFRRVVATGPVDTQVWTLLPYSAHAAYVAYAILRYPLCSVPGPMDLHRQLARRQWYERQKGHIDAACCAEARDWLDIRGVPCWTSCCVSGS